MSPALSALIVAVGSFYFVMGVAWIGSDRSTAIARFVRTAFLYTPPWVPRDAILGFVPAGIGLSAVGVGSAIGRDALLLSLYAGGVMGLVACWLCWTAPWFLKPAWVREEEASGVRSVRMDRWDRGLTVAFAIMIVLFMVLVSVLALGS